MFNVGAPEIMVILLVALLFLGPQRLPDAARQVGKAIGEFRRISGGLQAEVRDAFAEPINAFQESMNASASEAAPSYEAPDAPPVDAAPDAAALQAHIDSLPSSLRPGAVEPSVEPDASDDQTSPAPSSPSIFGRPLQVDDGPAEG